MGATSGSSGILVAPASRYDSRRRPPVLRPRPLRRLPSRAHGARCERSFRTSGRRACPATDVTRVGSARPGTCRLRTPSTRRRSRRPTTPRLLFSLFSGGRGIRGAPCVSPVGPSPSVTLLPSSPASVASRHPVGRTLAPEEPPGTRVRLARAPPCGHERFNSLC